MPAAKPQPSAAPESPPEEVPVNKVEKFLEENFKKIVLGFGLIALLVVAIGTSRHFSHQTELEASERFTAAKTPEDCDIVVQKYPGTLAAGNALLLKADLLWEAGKKESSIATLQEFVKNQAGHPLLANALLGLGSKQAALGDKDSARKTLEGIIRDQPKSEVAAAAATQLGDMLWAEGKIEDAKKLFLELPRNNPGSPFIEQVEERTKMMNAALPTKEVDPPPAPKAAEAPKPVPALPGAPVPVPSIPGINAPTLTPAAVPPAAATPPVAAPAAPVPPKPDGTAARPAAPTPPAPAAPVTPPPAKP